MNDNTIRDMTGCYPLDDMVEAHEDMRDDEPEIPESSYTTTEKLMRPGSDDYDV
jgi:hypothetical protein